jgi:hypothetical protein
MSYEDVAALAVDWRKASHSVNNGACVEVGLSTGRVVVRDSVNPAGPVVSYPAPTWDAFLARTKAGTSTVIR